MFSEKWLRESVYDPIDGGESHKSTWMDMRKDEEDDLIWKQAEGCHSENEDAVLSVCF